MKIKSFFIIEGTLVFYFLVYLQTFLETDFLK